MHDHGDWGWWLIFFLRGVVAAAGEAANTVRNILQLCEQHRLTITEHLEPIPLGRSAGNGAAVRINFQ